MNEVTNTQRDVLKEIGAFLSRTLKVNQKSGTEYVGITQSEMAFFDSVSNGKVHNAKGATIRSEFFREFLIRCNDIPNAALGVGIKNCYIPTTLNISGLRFDRLLSITGSRINGDFIFNHADIKALFLDGTHVQKVQGVRANVSASIYLRSQKLPLKDGSHDDLPRMSEPVETVRRFVAINGVDISGAKIAGALSARGARIIAEEDSNNSRNARGHDPSMAVATGSVVPPDENQSMKKNGRGKSRLALNLADCDISSIILGPKDDNDLNSLEEENPLIRWAPWKTKRKDAHATRFDPQPGKQLPVDECVIKGGLSFQRARCKSFTDSELAYSETLDAKSEAVLILRGFRYESLGRKARMDTDFRLKWLRKDAQRAGDEFDPQPFEQLAAVLKSHGHERTAHDILIDKERRMTPFVSFRRPDWIWPLLIFWALFFVGLASFGRSEWVLPPMILLTLFFFRRGLKRLLLEFIGFGYRPSLVLIPMAVLLVIASLFYNGAFARGELSPVSPAVSGSLAWIECHQRATDASLLISPHNAILSCKRDIGGLQSVAGWESLTNYPDFNGYWYALDVLLPIISLRQEEFWTPVSQARSLSSVRSMTHLFTLLGWILSSLAIAGILSFLNRSSR